VTSLSTQTVHTVEQLVAVLQSLPPTLPVAVYAEEGGFTTHIERGVRVDHIAADCCVGEHICIENND
jgi:hypothetical protein